MTDIKIERRTKGDPTARCISVRCNEPVFVPKFGLCRSHYNNAKHRRTIPVTRREPLTDYNAPCSYDAAIQRTRVHRGTAKEQACIECGGQAQCWRYIPGTSEHEQTMPDNRPGRAPRIYSGDPQDWVPMCMVCRRFTQIDADR